MLSEAECVGGIQYYFQGQTHVIDSSELFEVAAIHWRKEIKHVGVCRDMQKPVRHSNSDGYFKRRKKKLTCKSVFLCLFFIYL